MDCPASSADPSPPQHRPLDAVDFSGPCTVDLAAHKLGKTVDIGLNGVSLSLDAHGGILQATAFHPIHGIILAEPFEQFDGSKFHDPSYVRAYRMRMLDSLKDDRRGFGLDFCPATHSVSIDRTAANTVVFRFALTAILQISMTVNIEDNGNCTQLADVTNCGHVPAAVPFSLNLGLSLNRASYGQLTEGGPMALPQSQNQLRRDGEQNRLTVLNPHLGAQLRASLMLDGVPVDLSGVPDQQSFGAPLDTQYDNLCIVPPTSMVTLRTVFRLDAAPGKVDTLAWTHNTTQTAIGSHNKSMWKDHHIITTYIVRSNIHYILSNCLVPITDDTAAIITDHVALPLGWNRDNYWQIRLLLVAFANLHILVNPATATTYAEQIHDAAKHHLGWVFSHAQRPRGYWHRSYLVTGRPKDQFVFQLDQQCYPLLELCDYFDHFPHDVEFVKRIAHSGAVQEVLDVLFAKQDPDTGLWPTDETPGDDAVVYPYHFSSHVLLWRTFLRLSNLFDHIKSPYSFRTQHLKTEASKLREKCIKSFTFAQPETEKIVFAYLVDGTGQRTFYHDANDVPTLFALEWGFVSTPDEISIWKNTMEFGLSPANKDGYCSEEPYGGLGSVHSPGAWPLGYFQELAYAAQGNDTLGMRASWTKIAAAMQWDGTFSEAVDPTTAACTSKAWFSWPGAMIGALLIQMRLNGQEQVLLRGNDMD